MTDKNIFETKDEYYSNTEARINTILDFQSSNTWRMIVAARRHWSSVDHGDLNFWQWTEQQWGIHITVNDDGTINHVFTIVDEAKYTMFLLKFA